MIKNLIDPNAHLLNKWDKSNQPRWVLDRFPELAERLIASSLLSQMRINGDQIQELNGSPAILVEGELTAVQAVFDRFEVTRSCQRTVLIDRNDHLIYTYLGNGRGLEQHNPLFDIQHPIATLSPEEYKKTLEVAQTFKREGDNQGRNYILQIVSGYIPSNSSRFSQFWFGPQHPYLRLINPQGEVREMGYGFHGSAPRLPLAVTTGRFSSPDPWEYRQVDERVVTNIAITELESRRCLEFTNRYQADDRQQPGFHIITQNCCVYLKKACKEAGIEIEAEISFPKVLERMIPEWIIRWGRVFGSLPEKGEAYLGRWIPPSQIPRGVLFVKQKIVFFVEEVASLVFALLLAPLGVFLGDMYGSKRILMVSEEGEKYFSPRLRDWRVWVDLHTYRLHHPTIVQEWQRKQLSTRIYQNPQTFSIVPPPEQALLKTVSEVESWGV